MVELVGKAFGVAKGWMIPPEDSRMIPEKTQLSFYVRLLMFSSC